MTPNEIKSKLALEPHPVEGGHFRRTYTSKLNVETIAGFRPIATAIYYLLEPGTFSEMHRLESDEIFHFYLGDPIEMLQLHPDGSSRVFTLGRGFEEGEHVQLLVPAGVWQGMRLKDEGAFALMGCTVSPGFDFVDYTSGTFSDLSGTWPRETERIRELTRK